MSSPLALRRRTTLRRAAVGLHRSVSHGHRVRVLAGEIAAAISTAAAPHARPACLDIGCGDMSLARALGARFPDSAWTCIDVHELPDSLAGDPQWQSYRRFDGAHVPYPDASFDFALLCDVLHHAAGDAAALLAESARVARWVVVKDHFEYGVYSRSMLRLMDFVGNWGYGVSVPRRYFTRAGFLGLVRRQTLGVLSLRTGLRLYDHVPGLRAVLRPEWQFIAVLGRRR